MLKNLFIVASIIVILALIIVFILRLQSRNNTSNTSLTPQTNTTPTANNAITENIQIGKQPNINFSLPEGFAIGVFADGLGKARDLQFSPEGILLVSDQNGRIWALSDTDNDGEADNKKVLLSDLDTPHGLAFYNGKLYVAQEQVINRYHWNSQELTATFDKKIMDLPRGGNHVTRSLVFNDQGQMFVTIGSTCNVCIENNPWYAAVIVSDAEGNNPRLYAKGLRNTVFLKIKPGTNQLWGADMGRDLIGDNIPPEEINIIQEGQDYGWPYCYGDQVRDANFQPNVNYQCNNTISPIGTMTAHSAPLGLTFINSPQFPNEWQGDLLVALHGSWNRSTPSGYKLIRMDVEGDKIVGQEDFLTGFMQGSVTEGRPADVEFDNQGSLYVSDDRTGSVYKVIYK